MAAKARFSIKVRASARWAGAAAHRCNLQFFMDDFGVAVAQLAADQSVQRLLHSSSLPVLHFGESVLLGQRAVAHGQKVQQSERRQAVLHDGGAGHDAGVMAALDLQLRIGPADIIHGMLLLIDAGRRLEHRAEHDGHTVGNAAVDAAVLVRGGGDFAVPHRERIVGLAAVHCGKAEARAELNALAGWDGEHQVGQLALNAVEPRLANARGQTGHNRFQNAADAVALAARSADSGCMAPPSTHQQRKVSGLRVGHDQPRSAGKRCVLQRLHTRQYG